MTTSTDLNPDESPQHSSLSTRAKRALCNAGLRTRAEARAYLLRFKKMRNAGKKTVAEIWEWVGHDPLPCPFCGQQPTFSHVPREQAAPEIMEPYWSLGCPSKPLLCTATPMSFGDTKAEAVFAWNRRS
jgi:hypothetical protein